MKTNSEIRQDALSVMSGNWGLAMVASFVLLVIIHGCSIISTSFGAVVDEEIGSLGIVGLTLSLVTSLFIAFPLRFSAAMNFMQFVRSKRIFYTRELFSIFSSNYYKTAISLYFWTNLYTFLWSLLLIVPGIVKGLSYSLAPYILLDNPNLTTKEAINESMKLMEGHKADLFRIKLGYWCFIAFSSFAFGLPILAIYPYYQVVMVKFYEELRGGRRYAAA